MEPQLLTHGTHPLRAGRFGRAQSLTDGAGAARRAGLVPVGALAGAVGVLFGGVAALADGSTGVAGSLGVTLSLPGPWIAAAVLVVLGAVRGGVDRQALRGAVAMTAFLVAGMGAYYASKQLLFGAIPGPLVAFWVVLAGGLGLIGGVGTAWVAARPAGRSALLAAVAGWWWVEALVVASAPAGEAALAAIGTAACLTVGRTRGVGALMAGGLVGAGGAYLVLGALPAVLSRVL